MSITEKASLQCSQLNKYQSLFHVFCFKEVQDISSLIADLNYRDYFFAEQVHGRDIEVITDVGKYVNIIPGVDGLVTDKKKIALILKTADCIPLLLWDSVKRVIGAFHVGRKGTESGIAHKAIDTMVSSFKSNPADVLAVIGPSICKRCYQIDKVRDIHYDLWGENRQQLSEAGVGRENIITLGVCTACDKDARFHSYRRDGTKERNLSVILMH